MFRVERTEGSRGMGFVLFFCCFLSWPWSTNMCKNLERISAVSVGQAAPHVNRFLIV